MNYSHSVLKGIKGGRRVCFQNLNSPIKEVFLCNVKKIVLDSGKAA